MSYTVEEPTGADVDLYHVSGSPAYATALGPPVSYSKLGDMVDLWLGSGKAGVPYL